MSLVHELAPWQEGEWERKARRILASGAPPHFAPDAGMLAILRRRLEAQVSMRGTAGTALVLGATPELAELALAAGLRVVSVDRSTAMFAAAAQRRRFVDTARETTLVADWLDMPAVADGSIDIVLGDAALNNLPHERMDGMITALARITRPGSLVLLRQIVLPETRVPRYEFAAALAAWRAGRIDGHDFDRALRFHAFNAEALDPARHELDARRVFRIVRDKHAAGELSSAEFDFLMGRYSEVRHTIYPVPEQRRLLERLGHCDIDWLPESCFFRELMAVFVVRVA